MVLEIHSLLQFAQVFFCMILSLVISFLSYFWCFDGFERPMCLSVALEKMKLQSEQQKVGISWVVVYSFMRFWYVQLFSICAFHFKALLELLHRIQTTISYN